MPEIPPDISKWHKSCLAKLILKNWPPSGMIGAAMEVMANPDRKEEEGYLCSFYRRYTGAHPDTPKEILSELSRRDTYNR